MPGVRFPNTVKSVWYEAGDNRFPLPYKREKSTYRPPGLGMGPKKTQFQVLASLLPYEARFLPDFGMVSPTIPSPFPFVVRTTPASMVFSFRATLEQEQSDGSVRSIVPISRAAFESLP